MSRLEGFYWVKSNGRTTIAEWDGDSWYLPGSDLPYDERRSRDLKVLSAAPLKGPGEGDAYTGFCPTCHRELRLVHARCRR